MILTGFILGFVGSLHCAGMCGPLLMLLPKVGATPASFIASRLLYNLGPYPAAIRVGKVDRYFRGYVLEIALAELVNELDPFEQVQHGLYRRIEVVTEAGFTAWLYEYARPLAKDAIGPNDRWP